MSPRAFLVIVHPYPPTPSSGAHRWGAIVKYLSNPSTGTIANAARARIVRMIRPVGFSTLGAEEPAGRPRAATLEERPDSAGQGAG